jgi:hypothetical protein
MKCYIDFYDSTNGFKKTRKDFETFEDAWEWMLETFDTPNKDFINYY